jgi:acetyl-CoA C-acetyltransferase
MLDAYIFAGVRTPIGRHAGALSSVRPDDLLAGTIRTLIERTAIDPATVEDVIVGCANQSGEDSRCVARNASLLAGLPVSVPGTVIQRNCGSGLGAVIAAAHAATCGEGDLFVAGGVESMSRAPFVMGKAETAFQRQAAIYDSALGPRFPNRRLDEAYGSDSMARTADNLAMEFRISREEADAYALRSQQRYAAAKRAGFFDGEIVPVSRRAARSKEAPAAFTDDEHPRADITMDKLAALKTINPEGVTTAGNASGLNDGAAALLVGTLAGGTRAGLRPLVRIVASAVAGVAPRIMGIGPVDASRKALRRAGLDVDRVDVAEINEAFAAQVLACLAGLGIDKNDDRVNPNGGAIAIGHPLGASGARIALTATRELGRRNGRYALVSMCIGIGQGIAVVLERV